MDYFWIFLVYGIVLSVALVYISFFDLLSVIIKVIPNKEIDGYEEYKRLRSSVEYKRHRKKWSQRMVLVSVLGYIVAYILITLLTKNIAIGFCLSLFIGLLCASRLKSRETQERKAIENKTKK